MCGHLAAGTAVGTAGQLMAVREDQRVGDPEGEAEVEREAYTPTSPTNSFIFSPTNTL